MQELIEISKTEIIVVLSTLTAVITLLWKVLSEKDKKEAERLERCERLHNEASEEVKILTGEFNFLKGRIEGIENLSRAVLKAINEADKKK